MLGDIKYQPIIITVSSSGETVTVEADTDKLYARCTGIYISVPDEDVLTSTLSKLELGGKELFPDGYEVKMLNTSNDVPLDQLYYELNEPAKGARLKTSYTDSGMTGTYPYNAILYLRLENK
jgi:hypothetical protein